MTAAAFKLLQAALKLKPTERVQLARQLLEISPQSPEEIERSWIDEATRRNEEMDTVGEKGEPWESVHTEILAKL